VNIWHCYSSLQAKAYSSLTGEPIALAVGDHGLLIGDIKLVNGSLQAKAYCSLTGEPIALVVGNIILLLTHYKIINLFK